MSSVLYRKYRSQSFADVRGQETIIKILKQAIISKKISHAYLFAGPRGTGKTSMARLFAKAVNDENFAENGDIDTSSEVSKQIEAGSYLDLIEIDAASNRGIDEIRQLKDQIRYLPTRGKYKVYIIDEVHMLTREAFNALLKTLEEPPAHVIFVLATTEPQKLPATILSRVQRHDFGLANRDQLVDKITHIADLEGIKLDSDVLDVIFNVSGGSFRDAESILDKLFSSIKGKSLTLPEAEQILGLADSTQISKFIQLLQTYDVQSVVGLLRELSLQGSDLKYFLHQCIKELHAEILSENNLDPVKIRLVAKLVEIESALKNYHDTLLLLELEIVKNFGSKDIRANLVAKKVEKSPGLKESLPVKGNSNDSNNDELANDKLTDIFTQVKNLDRVLWLALKAARLKKSNNSLEIIVRSETIMNTIKNNKNFDNFVKLLDNKFQISKIEFTIESNIEEQKTDSSSQVDSQLVKSNASKVEQLF